MVIREDGTKWACQSCLKGHRVSGCTHMDRELTLVPKKGRPVTQCQHCRLERKKRSAHVKCDCGEGEKLHHSKEKCIHLREAEERAKAGFHDAHLEDKDAAHLTATAEDQGCCCLHGLVCSCAALKKEVEQDDATPPHGPAVKPRLETTKSDGSITVFQNGHHKPVHRKNHAAHECGMPYKVPMPKVSTEQSTAKVARRSVDSLSLDSNTPFNPSGFTPQTSAPYNTARRLSKSEQPSPRMFPNDGPCGGLGAPHLTDIDFSTLGPTTTNQSFQSATSDTLSFPTADPMSGVADSSYDPWSSLPSGDSVGMPNNNPFGVWPTNEISNAMAQPALTAASSGTQSEIDEIPPIEDAYGFGMPSIQEDTASINLNSVIGESSPQSNRHSLPPNFFSSSDLIIPNLSGDWQASMDDFTGNDQNKTKSFGSPQSVSLEGPWQVQSTASVPQRSISAFIPLAGRPTSQSVGTTNAPNEDLMQQLFPGIDVNGMMCSSSPSMVGKTQNAAPTSNPVEFGPLDENVGFTSQPWSDGSLSIPHDTYTSSYDLDQDFSNADFSTWAQ